MPDMRQNLVHCQNGSIPIVTLRTIVLIATIVIIIIVIAASERLIALTAATIGITTIGKIIINNIIIITGDLDPLLAIIINLSYRRVEAIVKDQRWSLKCYHYPCLQ